MQFVVRVDVENAVVRILSDHAMQLLPLTLPLKLLGVCFFASLDFIGPSRWYVVWQVYVHSYEIKHGSLPKNATLLAVHWQEYVEVVGSALSARALNCFCRDGRRRAFP